MKDFSDLLQWLNQRRRKTREPVNISELSSMDLWKHIQKHGCVTCDRNPDFTVIEGPSGGMSTNVWCPECGTRYNITRLSDSQGLIDILAEHERDFGTSQENDESRENHESRENLAKDRDELRRNK